MGAARFTAWVFALEAYHPGENHENTRHGHWRTGIQDRAAQAHMSYRIVAAVAAGGEEGDAKIQEASKAIAPLIRS